MAGQGTSANPVNPPQLGSPLDMPRVQAVAANQAPMANQVAPVAAEVYERQIANIQRRLDQQATLQRRLDEQDELLRQQEAALELRSRENQQRHQSLLGRKEPIDPANLFNTPQEHQVGGNPVVGGKITRYPKRRERRPAKEFKHRDGSEIVGRVMLMG